MSQSTSSNTAESLAWWRAARFGLFIHWGLYAVPAGIWRGQETPGIGEWLMSHFKIPLAEYRKFASEFNPTEFNPVQVVSLAKEAGMKYIVITAKHHDGFAMWDSQVSDYNIVKATPYKRDVLKALAAECAKQGMRLGFYYSQDLDWEHPDGGLNTWDFDPAKKNFARYLEQKVKPQLRELLTNYGPVALIWCDTPVHITAEQSRDLKQFIQSIQPGCLVSGRIGHGVGDYESLGDNTFPVGRLEGNWETPATLNDTWGFKVNDHKWKSTDRLLQLLVDLSSKGVNYLLNIGPTATGAIPQPSIDRLREIGTWLKINGEAIYDAQPNPFPYDFTWGRITSKSGKLFFFFTQPPTGKFILYGVRNVAQRARYLNGGQPIGVQQVHDTARDFHSLELSFPNQSGTTSVSPIVVEVSIQGDANVDESILQQPSGDITLPSQMAGLHLRDGKSPKVIMRPGHEMTSIVAESANERVQNRLTRAPNGLILNWFNTGDWIDWEFRVDEPGEFQVVIHTVARKYKPWEGGHQVRVVSGNQSISGPIQCDETIHSPRTEHYEESATRLGTIRIDHAGRHCLELHADKINLMLTTGLCVSEIRLSRYFGAI